MVSSLGSGIFAERVPGKRSAPPPASPRCRVGSAAAPRGAETGSGEKSCPANAAIGCRCLPGGPRGHGLRGVGVPGPRRGEAESAGQLAGRAVLGGGCPPALPAPRQPQSCSALQPVGVSPSHRRIPRAPRDALATQPPRKAEREPPARRASGGVCLPSARPTTPGAGEGPWWSLLCGVSESWQRLKRADANHIPERHPAAGSIQLARAGARVLDGTQPPTGARGGPGGWGEPGWGGHPTPSILISPHPASLLQTVSINKAINAQEVAVKEKHARNILPEAGRGSGAGAARRRAGGEAARGERSGAAGPARRAGCRGAEGGWVGSWGALDDGWRFFPSRHGVLLPLLVTGCPALCSRRCHPAGG